MKYKLGDKVTINTGGEDIEAVVPEPSPLPNGQPRSFYVEHPIYSGGAAYCLEFSNGSKQFVSVAYIKNIDTDLVYPGHSHC